jgi:hypothetical protein
MAACAANVQSAGRIATDKRSIRHAISMVPRDGQADNSSRKPATRQGMDQQSWWLQSQDRRAGNYVPYWLMHAAGQLTMARRKGLRLSIVLCAGILCRTTADAPASVEGSSSSAGCCTRTKSTSDSSSCCQRCPNPYPGGMVVRCGNSSCWRPNSWGKSACVPRLKQFIQAWCCNQHYISGTETTTADQVPLTRSPAIQLSSHFMSCFVLVRHSMLQPFLQHFGV